MDDAPWEPWRVARVSWVPAAPGSGLLGQRRLCLLPCVGLIYCPLIVTVKALAAIKGKRVLSSEMKVLERPGWPAAWPFYYGWVNVLLAALAMTATLPGRTHGLGLITRPLLEDMQLT